MINLFDHGFQVTEPTPAAVIAALEPDAPDLAPAAIEELCALAARFIHLNPVLYTDRRTFGLRMTYGVGECVEVSFRCDEHGTMYVDATATARRDYVLHTLRYTGKAPAEAGAEKAVWRLIAAALA